MHASVVAFTHPLHRWRCLGFLCGRAAHRLQLWPPPRDHERQLQRCRPGGRLCTWASGRPCDSWAWRSMRVQHGTACDGMAWQQAPGAAPNRRTSPSLGMPPCAAVCGWIFGGLPHCRAHLGQLQQHVSSGLASMHLQDGLACVCMRAFPKQALARMHAWAFRRPQPPAAPARQERSSRTAGAASACRHDYFINTMQADIEGPMKW